MDTALGFCLLHSIFSEGLGELSVIKTELNFKGFGSEVKGGFEFGTEPLRGEPPPPLAVGS